jgi:cytochrome subunit of sulfide dehydrogenase
MGKSVEGASVPGLAGLPASYIADQMKAFKAGTRPATVMHQLAKGYSDAQIDQLAAYFAAQPK